MKLLRVGDLGHEIPAVLRDGVLYDLRSITADITGSFFTSGGVERVSTALDEASLPRLQADDSVRIGSPVTRPRAVICIGMNYAAHAAESGEVPPELPIMFLKPPNTVVGPNDSVDIPRTSTKTDWEVEPGIVIGRRRSTSTLSIPRSVHRRLRRYERHFRARLPTRPVGRTVVERKELPLLHSYRPMVSHAR